MVTVHRAAPDQVAVSSGAQANWFALGIVTFVFFMWGFLTSLNDVLIPHLKSLFSLNYAQSMLVQFTFFGAYFVMSLPCGKLVSRLGYKHSIVLGLLIAAGGALLFYPAASLPSYALFLGALFILATGITLLQVAANPYVSLLGPASSASMRLNLVQAFNSLGTTLAPKFGGVLILSGVVLGAAQIVQLPEAERLSYNLQQAQLVQGPYLGLAITLAALALLFYIARLPVIVDDTTAEEARTHRFVDALRHRNLRLGTLAIFVYVGAEVAIGSFLINYIAQADIGNMTQAQAANYVAFYWGGAMVGRFIGAALMRKIAPRRLLATAAAVDVLLLLTTMLSHGPIAVWSIVAIGLFNSIMFPTIFTLGIDRLGPLTGKASSLLIMAIVGGAVIPLLQGVLADRIGIQQAFVLPLLCYLYIGFYGVNGSRVGAAA
ncbi:MAG TPA: sugar MFS transporter [Rudaea sp.]|nr:sugar MFS transporter [Rudaea sp.]